MSETPPMSLSRSPPADASCATDMKVERTSYGIFEVAYERPPQRLSLRHFADAINSLLEPLPFVVRLFQDLFSLAPLTFVSYGAASFWEALAPALSVYFSKLVLDHVERYMTTGKLDKLDLNFLQLVVVVWFFSALITSTARRSISDTSSILNAHMKAHFNPHFARVSLQMDLKTSLDPLVQESLPTSWGRDMESSGWECVKHLSMLLESSLAACLLVLVLLYSASTRDKYEAAILVFYCIAVPVVVFLTPSNGLHGAGYAYWTHNRAYHRLNALHTMVFDTSYRPTILKDGATEYLYDDYRRTVDELGIVKADEQMLSYGLPAPWYWEFFQDILVELPLFLCVARLTWSPSPASLTTMVLAQLASSALQNSVRRLRLFRPFVEVLATAKKLYDTIEDCEILKAQQGTAKYPDPHTSSSEGMKLSFRNVCLQYSGRDEQPAVDDVSFDVEAGQLVVVVGSNGSGKSTLLKLLPRLMDSTSGEILIDGKPSTDYDLRELRRSMAVLLQCEEIYPVSVRDNLLMGLAKPMGSDPKLTEKMDVACEMGGAYDLVQRLGYDRIPRPFWHYSTSMEGCGVGPASEAVMEEVRRHTSYMDSDPVSGGEEQRLIASRTFMRLNNSDIRLLVVDEATSALDPVAERHLLTQFRNLRQGKTMVFVTHRFGHLVKQADLIICMNDGKIVQRGKHDDLMEDIGGEYARLYNAQAEGFTDA